MHLRSSRISWPRVAFDQAVAILQEDPADSSKGLLEFSVRFVTELDCRYCLTDLRWLRGVVRPRCAGTRAWPMAHGQEVTDRVARLVSGYVSSLHSGYRPECEQFAVGVGAEQLPGRLVAASGRTEYPQIDGSR